MAKTVGDLLIKLDVEGIKGIEALKGSLRGLSRALGPSDTELAKLAKEVKNFSREGGDSVAVIKGQIAALNGLQEQASVSGKTFQDLGRDVKVFEKKLQEVELQAKKTERAITFRGASTKFIAQQPGALLARIGEIQAAELAPAFTGKGGIVDPKTGELTEGIQQRRELSVLTKVQARLQERLSLKIREGTTATIDNNNENKTAAELLGKYGKELNDGAETTARMSMRLRELREDFQDLAIGSKEYSAALREINLLEQRVVDPFGTASRKQEIRGRLGRQETFGMFAGRDPVQSAIERRKRRRSRRYGGYEGGGLANQPVEASGLFKQIASISGAGRSSEIEMMGKSYAQVADSIRDATLASNGSINSLQAQRASWASLRAGLDPASKAYRDVGREIEKVDQRLEKLNRRRRRPTLGGAAQVLGGIAAGGVFGGPEGAIGAAAGAPFGVGGVAAGAALGAQVKMLREALAATSDYSATLKKLEIALQGVTAVENDATSSLGNYQAGLNAARKVTKDFNVPLDVSTKGITRLAAAVIGAGGNIEDAEIVFRNVTAAIKATGGGAQDVESAITAMVQTFSKGKVSAEELSGQLGERLPGAVTKFAEANNMTLPELQKAFKAGTVGLDQLMKFIISLGPEYEKVAKRIASSSADAGAKAAVAFDAVRREIGDALQPIGGELQQTFGEFVVSILPAIKEGAKAAASGIDLLLDAVTAAIANIKELVIIAGAAGAVGVFLNLTKIITAFKLAVLELRLAFVGLNATMLLNPYVALAAGAAAAAVALYKMTTANKRFNKSVMEGKTSNEEANDRLRDMNAKVKELEERIGKASNNRLIKSLTAQLRTARTAADDLKLAMKLASTYTVSGITYDRMTGKAIDAPMSYTATDFDDPETEDTGKGKRPMSDTELAVRDRIRQAQLDGNELLELQLSTFLKILRAEKDIEDTNERIDTQREAATQYILKERELRKQAKEEIDKQNKKLLEQSQLRIQAIREMQDAKFAAMNLTEEDKKRIEINRKLADFAAKYAGVMSSEELAAALSQMRRDLTKATASASSFKKKLKEVFDEAINVTKAVTDLGVQAVRNLGDEFAEFVATGKAEFKDLANSIIKDLSRIFARRALFQALSFIPGVGNFLGLAGGGGGGGVGGVGGSADTFAGVPNDILDSVLKNADGNAYGKNGIIPFARGGVVTRPTLFPMAKGAGLMGEAGPEAILPLRRGANGKLGVEASGGMGNIVVNVDASGSTVEGDERQSKALGAALGAAVQAEIIKQKMPGGLLS